MAPAPETDKRINRDAANLGANSNGVDVRLHHEIVEQCSDLVDRGIANAQQGQCRLTKSQRGCVALLSRIERAGESRPVAFASNDRDLDRKSVG